MAAPRVVVIEHDEWVLRLLEDGLRDAGFVVHSASNAAQAMAKIRELPPDCILCDIGLPGTDGYALALSVRAERPPISIVPVALLAPEDDHHARTAAFDAGADALITRPFRIEEVVAQTTALVQLARRMRERRNSLVDSLSGPPSSSSDAVSFRGELEHMPVASLLALLELERKSGVVTVRSQARRATVDLSDGFVDICAFEGSTDPITVLREIASWSEGKITFMACSPRARPDAARPIRALLAEARAEEAAPFSALGATSVSRMQAIPPPPGRRKSVADMKQVEDTSRGSSGKMPALTETPTRRVEVPASAVRPSGTDRKDGKG